MSVMKVSFYSILILTITIFIAGSCTGKKPEQPGKAEPVISPVSIAVATETRLLMQDLKENGDYVNSREFPSLIKASIVKEAVDQNQNIHIIDIRKPQLYTKGHIKGSVNKKFEDLPAYFESGIKPFEYDKIIVVCDDGQVSSYTTALLRLMGYGNVYALRWGMSSWNRENASNAWLSGLSSKYEAKLEKQENAKPAPTRMPEITTGFTTGPEIATARFKTIFSEGSDKIMITAEDVFANPGEYFVINYERKDKYDDAHIPGAVRYKPNATLSFTQEMATIPTDKTVVVYCGTGHNSSFATAYLRLAGYDARTLQYGNNAFMYDWMVKDEAGLSWLPFNEAADVNNYPVE